MTLATRRLMWQQPIQAKELQRYVYSYEELLQAIGDIVAKTPNLIDVVGNPLKGAAIIIAAPIKVKKPIVLPSKLFGTVITSVARHPIVPDGVVSSLFESRAASMQIRDLYVVSSSSSSKFTSFVTTLDTEGTFEPSQLSLINNTVIGDRFLVDSGFADYCSILGNRMTQIDSSASDLLHSESQFVNIQGNFFSPLGTDGIVVTGSTGRRTAIIGNSMGGGDITTDSGQGSNTIIGNTLTGTITAHATDVFTGLNT